jgi:methyl-accepting chemotaxis protein
MSLLQRIDDLPLPRKLALAAIPAMFTLALLAFLSVQSLNAQIEVVRREAAGVAYHRALAAVLQAAQKHRGAAGGVLAGRREMESVVQSASAEAGRAIEQVDAVDRDGTFSAVHATWAGLRREWTELQTGWRSWKPEESARRHTAWIARLLDVMEEVGNDSAMILDPEADAFRLFESMILHLPRLTESAGLARAFGVLAIAQGSASGDVARALSSNAGGIAARRAALERSFGFATRANKALDGVLAAPLAAVAKGTDAQLELIHSRILGRERIDLQATEYWDAATRAVDAQFALYVTMGIEGKRLLDEREAGFVRERRVVVASLVAGILGCLAIGWLIARRVVRRIGEAGRMAAAVAAGDFAAVSGNDRAKDEVGALVGSLAAVRDTVDRIIEGQLAMAAAHDRGETDHRLDAGGVAGRYAVLAGKVNDLVHAHVAIEERLASVLGAYARGDFAPEMPALPGRQAELTRAAREAKANLQALDAEITRLAVAAKEGRFGERGEAARFGGDYRVMVERLNALMAECERGLTDASRMFAALAKGDLTARIDTEYAGLFAQLKRDAHHTMESLAELVGRLRGASEAIDSAAGEIATGNADLSSRTEQQASALEQTAASMEQFSESVRTNAENARAASEQAAAARAVAHAGSEGMSRVMVTMDGITSSAKRIEDIIAVIDGIAFQTNILALNAAVEAARAGEEGRGFAVVASEVRALAGRSANAAREIKTLIHGSVNEIGTGAQQVNEVGGQVMGIVDSIDRVTALIEEIANASREQAAGIDQVTHAVSTMDQATQQNAALVEEAAAAAESLAEQSHGLVEAAGQFRVSSGDAQARRPAPARRAA